jgi:non-heme chloroperoxidase
MTIGLDRIPTARRVVAENPLRTGLVTTDDGVGLHYVEAGTGSDLLLVPGWSLSAEAWRYQIEEFSRTHHVIAVDHRGHGLSDKPTHGYRISRLAADAREVIEILGLSDVTWVGHAMGCAVGWAYWKLFGGDRLGGMVLIDQPAVAVAHPHWPGGMAEELGAVFEVADLAAVSSSLQGPDAEAATADLLALMWTDELAVEDRYSIIEQSMLLPREAAGDLLFDSWVQDWREVLPRISVPTLVIGGEASLFPAAAAKHVAASIPSSTLRILSAEERGSHLSLLENPSAVNGAIRSFVEGSPLPEDRPQAPVPEEGIPVWPPRSSPVPIPGTM